MNFTGSPIEYMMQHNRASRMDNRGSVKEKLPPEHPCYGCSYMKVFFVKYFSLKKASEFPFFSKGFSLPSAGIMHPCA